MMSDLKEGRIRKQSGVLTGKQQLPEKSLDSHLHILDRTVFGPSPAAREAEK